MNEVGEFLGAGHDRLRDHDRRSGHLHAAFTVRLTITTQPDYQLYEYACHEGNGAVKYALSGERAYEKSVAQAIAKGLPIPSRDTGNPYGPPAPGTPPVRIIE